MPTYTGATNYIYHTMILRFGDKMSNDYDIVELLTPNDIVEIFGNSGSGKSTIASLIADQYAKSGKSVLYIDTERNINVKNNEWTAYVYLPSYGDLRNYIINLKEHYDLVVLDSLGLPVLGEFAMMSIKQRGDALLTAEAIAYKLKVYSSEHGEVVVTNQPVSEFNRPQGAVLYPFGDKTAYFFKNIYYTKLITSNPLMTTIDVTAFRCRSLGRGSVICRVFINDSGVTVRKAQPRNKKERGDVDGTE